MTRVEHTTRGKGDKTMGKDGPPVSHYRNSGGGVQRDVGQDI
jgi:hypothetical protein